MGGGQTMSAGALAAVLHVSLCLQVIYPNLIVLLRVTDQLSEQRCIRGAAGIMWENLQSRWEQCRGKKADIACLPSLPPPSPPRLHCGCGVCLKAADCVENSFESFPLLLSLNKQLQMVLPSAAKWQGHTQRNASSDKWGTNHVPHQKKLHI